MKYRKTLRISVFVAVLTFLGALTASAQTFVVKNNLLYDATLTPNLGFEGAVAPRWTIGLNAGFNPWKHPYGDKEKQLRHFIIMPEARYWFCSTFAGHFIGVNAAYSHFNIAKQGKPLSWLYKDLEKYRYQGDMVAGGLFYGYSWILSNRWSLEAEIGADVGYAWWKKYPCAHCGVEIEKTSKPFVMPKAGVNIVFNIK